MVEHEVLDEFVGFYLLYFVHVCLPLFYLYFGDIELVPVDNWFRPHGFLEFVLDLVLYGCAVNFIHILKGLLDVQLSLVDLYDECHYALLLGELVVVVLLLGRYELEQQESRLQHLREVHEALAHEQAPQDHLYEDERGLNT